MLSAAVCVLPACGSPSPSSPPASHAATSASADATATPAPARTYLVVAGTPTSVTGFDNTVSILDTSGGVHGTINFTAPARPQNAHAISSIQEPATAAAGRAFYIDSSGAVHAFAPDASPSQVAQFPLQPGEEISVAVSPDGQQLMAIVTDQLGAGAGWHYDVYSASVGGGTRLVRGPAVSSTLLRLLTWTAAGPVVITDATAAFQGCEAGQCSPWGHAAFIDPTTGAIAAAVGGSDCDLWDVTATAVLCSSGAASDAGATPADLSVRAWDGAGARQVRISPRCAGCYWDARLSPGGDVAVSVLDSPGGDNTHVIRADGTTAMVPVPVGESGFAPYLWLDAHTIVGVTDCPSLGCTSGGGSLASVDTSGEPMHMVPLRVRGSPTAVFSA